MTKKIAYLFPGQGSQAPGMGRDAADRNPAAQALFAAADNVMEYEFSSLCFGGPEDELRKTQVTQPALYVASAATLEVLKQAGIAPHAVAGHSLGEYTALYAAGVFDFETGLRLVRTRGQAFAEAGSARPGAMAAILGLDIARIQECCAAASINGEVAVAANMNDPAQTVISGDPAAVERAGAACAEAGARKVVPLPVSGAFHSPLVAPAGAVMATALAGAAMAPPNCIFVNNADAAVLTDPDAIRDSLVRQVTSCVRWVECVQRLVAEGAEAFIEVGSGKVLAGLVRRIAKDVPCYTTESAASMDKAIAELGG